MSGQIMHQQNLNSTSAQVTGKYQLCREVVEVAFLIVLIIGVWSLMSLPVIFYHLPVSEISPNTSSSTNKTDILVCSAPLQYATTSGICLTEFANILTSSNCPLDSEGNVLVVSNEQASATQLSNGLTTIGASAECISKAVPLLCLHLFGLCGGSGISIQPTTSQCEEVRDTLCQQQWMFIEGLGFDLPDCAAFPSEAPFCPVLNHSLSTNRTDITNLLENYPSFPNGNEVLECTEDFYRENGSSICIPSCYTWTRHSNQLSRSLNVVTSICGFIGFISAIVVSIISCLRYKRMLTFPSIFIVYMIIDSLALNIFVMVNYMDRRKLFCSSRSLIESLSKVTPFCVISGISMMYMLLQVTIWWLLHTAAFFWKVMFPFHARAFEIAGKVKYIHIICGIVGVLLPLVPIITSMADFAVDIQKQNKNSTSQLRNSLFLSGGLGFGIVQFPPIPCISIRQDALFYSFLLMIDITLATGCSMLIIIIWLIYRQNVKFKVNMFGMAERKLLIVLCYYVLTAIISLTSSSLAARDSAMFVSSVQKYFFCEQGGHDPSNPCNRSDIEKFTAPSLKKLSISLLALFPVVNMLYAVNIQELKEVWRKLIKKMRIVISNCRTLPNHLIK